MTTGKQYHLKTIDDIYSQLSAEQIPVCLAEIAEALSLLKEMDAIAMAAVKELVAGKPIELPPRSYNLSEGFIWIDDGKAERTFEMDLLGETVVITNKAEGSSDD